ncbi:Hsp70 family protein [Roseibium polysiphoniae]|uniref:Hsp70 family protein n=1 Tax=Roseibium polysiphoniae TaxID=2571221 RepID=A0A944CFH4_9HYPH|nr:Hsp70 family protein [Roseibium polysiphoniae]MBS8262421.1 Hsp70 family protein [Roseibium polysiphoniae]
MPKAYGLDFGTSNTVLAACDSRAGATQLTFGTDKEIQSGIATLLSFLDRSPSGLPLAAVGPWAIQQFLEHMGDVRFIQSLKTFVASKQFKGTGVFGSPYDFERLMRTFVYGAFAHLSAPMNADGARLVVGRPVIFAGNAPDEELAMARYRKALASFGFDDILFVYEPVAAAFSFAQRLEQDALVLVADFGGGTSDYSLMRFSRKGGVLKATPLGRGGVAVAGDTFDYRIIDNVILPELGKGSHYKSMGKVLEVPPNLFSNFARWHLLSVFKTSDDYKEMKKLLRWCVEPDKIELFIDLVDEDQGYPLYKAVSDAKAKLSSQDSVELRFEPLGRDFEVTVTRSEFDSWIAEDLGRMDKALDQTLAAAGVADADVDQVFLTGGTSFVPALRSMFQTRFGAQKLAGGEELSSIATGLALIGAREDAGDWALA